MVTQKSLHYLKNSPQCTFKTGDVKWQAEHLFIINFRPDFSMFETLLHGGSSFTLLSLFQFDHKKRCKCSAVWGSRSHLEGCLSAPFVSSKCKVQRRVDLLFLHHCHKTRPFLCPAGHCCGKTCRSCDKSLLFQRKWKKSWRRDLWRKARDAIIFSGTLINPKLRLHNFETCKMNQVFILLHKNRKRNIIFRAVEYTNFIRFCLTILLHFEFTKIWADLKVEVH
jgi:hypothetical protein